MGIELTDNQLQRLEKGLEKALTDHGLFSKTNLENIKQLTLKAIGSEKRWCKITLEDLVSISLSYSKKIPNGDFRTNFGRILIRRRGDFIEREFFSKETVVKGWHREIISKIKYQLKLDCSYELSGDIYDTVQTIIMEKT